MISRLPLHTLATAGTAWVLFMSAPAGRAAEVDSEILFKRAQTAFEAGSFSKAAADWASAAEACRSRHDTNGEVRASIALASAYQSLGQYRVAVPLLETALNRAGQTREQSLITLAKWKLGAALVMTQESQRADVLLNEASAEARAKNDDAMVAGILNDVGNALASQQKFAEALGVYRESADLSRRGGNSPAAAGALCNAASMAARGGEKDTASSLNADALRAVRELPASHAKAFLLLTAGRTDRQIQLTDTDAQKRLFLRANESFQEALKISQQLEDRAMETYALGYLGQLYEQDGQVESALNLTRRAAFAAQQAQMPEALYRWEWQSARLLNKQGDTEASIAEYRRAVQTLKPIRTDISTGYGNGVGHASFREAVGPLFYELADLLLTQAKSAGDSGKKQQLLVEARDTVENLKTVELEDYLCEECLDILREKTRTIEAVDKHSAVIYLIPLPTRTEMLVGLNSGLKLYTINVGAEKLTTEVRDFRHNLETRTTFGYLEQSQRLYDWMIRPILGTLKENQINTLVFVPDGALRTVPFAALHDGEHFLIQDLAVAVVPGLSMVEPKALERRNVRLLLNGISEPVQGFAPLSFVTNELRSINQIYSSQTLLNQKFTLTGLETKLRDDQFSIVHIASHGQFDRDVRKTFVLTYDNKLSLDDLETAIRPSQYRGKPVELLVLSACQTAAGDDRAALGLAGVAIKAGARSALASLWFVNDQSTSALITEFYEQLRTSPNLSKAQALQAAQIKLLTDRRYRHPCYWSPYLIVGNWL